MIYNNFLYVTNLNDGTISQISLQDGSIVNPIWCSGLNGPSNLVIYESYMYVTNLNGGTISQINLIDGSIVNPEWATGFFLPIGLVVYGTNLYVSDLVNGTIRQLSLIPTNPSEPIIDSSPPNTIIQNIMNNVLSSQKAMPLKDSTSTGDSNFSGARHQYIEALNTNPVSNQKKWIGGNRDASDRIRNLRVNTIGLGTLNAVKQPMSFTTSIPTNTVREAKKRVRSGGATVPAKVTHKYENAPIFY